MKLMTRRKKLRKLKVEEIALNISKNSFAYKKAMEGKLKYVGNGCFINKSGEFAALAILEGSALFMLQEAKTKAVAKKTKKQDKLLKGPETKAGTERFYFVDKSNDLHLVTKGYGTKQGWGTASQNDVQSKKPAEGGGASEEKPEETQTTFNDEQLSRLTSMANSKLLSPQKKAMVKLALLGSGADVEFSKEDLKAANSLVISATPVSGRLYTSADNLSKSGAFKVDEVPGMSPVEFKNTVLDNIETLKEKIPNFKPNFKTKGGVTSDIGYKSISFKPQNLLGNMDTSKASDVLPPATMEYLARLSGSTVDKVKDIELFDGKLDRDRPETFINAIDEYVTSAAEKVNDSGEDVTKKYMKNYTNAIAKVTRSKMSPEDKMKQLRRVMPAAFVDAYESASEVAPEEAASFLADWGEIGSTMEMLARGEEIYVPKTGNFQLADLLRVDKDAMKLHAISIKSKYPGSSEGAASSAKAYMELLEERYKDNKELRTQFNDALQLYASKLSNVDQSEMSPSMRKKVSAIEGVDNMGSLDEAQSLVDKMFDEEQAKKTKAKIDRALKKLYSKNKGLDKDFSAVAPFVREIMFRDLMINSTNDIMKKTDVEIPVEYFLVNIDKNGISFNAEGKPKTNQMRAEEKYAVVPKIEGNRVVDAKCDQGYPGLRPNFQK